MLDKPVHQLEEKDIVQVVVDQVPEGKTLDYKQALPGNEAKERVRFLADVTAMANAAGGLLLYGIAEKRDGRDTTGIPEDVPGLDINADMEVRRLDNMVSQSVKPRIHGVQFHAIRLSNGKTVLAVKVPRSWNAPHVVEYENHWRFYTRSAAGNRQMDVDELRAAMTLAETISQRLNQFRLERLSRVAAGETPVPLPSGAKTVLHILPLGMGDPLGRLDIADLSRRSNLYGKLLPLHSGADFRINMDGILAYSLRMNGPGTGYVQLFRSGAIEVVDVPLLQPRRGIDNPYIPSTSLEEGLLQSTGQYFQALQEVKVEPPVFVGLSLLGVRGYTLATRSRAAGEPVDRDDLILPEQLVESLSASPEAFMRPIFDVLWQACGYACCLDYDEQGKWHH